MPFLPRPTATADSRDSKFRLTRFHRVARWTGLLSSLCVVPITLMWQVLIVSPNSHLANPGPLPTASTVTDLDGAARLVYLLSDMPTPWSETHLISSPSGASIWRVQSLTQSVQIVSMWLLSQVFQPMFVVNLFVLMGWILTGVVVFLLARELGLSTTAAVIASLLVQTLPSMKFMAANFTSYVYVAVPLGCVLMFLRLRERRTARSLFLFLVTLSACVFFDPYWAFFVLLIAVLLTTLTLAGDIWTRKGLQQMIQSLVALVVLGLMWTAGLAIAHRMGETDIGRSVGKASHVDVRNSALTLSNLVSTKQMGVGPLLPIAFLVSVVHHLLFSKSKIRLTAAASCLMMMASLRFFVVGTDYEIVPASLLRHVMPGVRFFDRAALIGVALGVILVIGSMEALVSAVQPNRRVTTISLCFLLFVPFSYPGLGIPKTTKSYDDWSQIRNELAKSKDARVLALPFSRRGRDWIEQASFRAPIANDLAEIVQDPDTILHVSLGPRFFAAYLKAIGVTHLLSSDLDFERFVEYKLESEYFERISHIVLNGFGEGPDYSVDLYRVSQSVDAEICERCPAGPHLKPDIRVTGDLVYPADMLPDGSKWWWLGAGAVDVSITEFGQLLRFDRERKRNFELQLAPCASTAVITISDESRRESVSLTQLKPKVSVSGTLAQGVVSLNIRGKICVPPGDNRPMLVQFRMSDQ
jgi:hypothetical protein